MASGEKIEFTRQDISEPAKIKFVTKDGETLVDNLDAQISRKDLEEVSSHVTEDKNYMAMKARLHSAMKNIIKHDCALFSAKKSFRYTKLPETGIYSNTEKLTNSHDANAKGGDLIAHTDLVDNAGNTDPSVFQGGGDYGGSGGFGSGGAGYSGDGSYVGFSASWAQSDFEAFAAAFVADDFAFNFNQFVTTNTLMPNCNEVIIQCTSFCQSMGTYEAGACLALGGAAAALSGPIGVAVGAYCSGKVWIATEECKQNCRVVPVPCK